MAVFEKSDYLSVDGQSPVRLNKYLSDAGYCSRRQADKLIARGEVEVDGIPADLGTKVFPGQEVKACGQVLARRQELILLVYNKPAGVECTTAQDNPDNIVSAVGYPERVFPVGRLDKNSTGLILLTNTGELVNKIMRSVNGHEKEYEVQVDRQVTKAFLKNLSAGVFLEELDVVTRPCQVLQTGPYSFTIILTQGYNRQIRRMCEAFGYHVKSLHRTRIMNLRLGSLQEGSWRYATEQELRLLAEQIKKDK